jgi:hypothetical protein
MRHRVLHIRTKGNSTADERTSVCRICLEHYLPPLKLDYEWWDMCIGDPGTNYCFRCLDRSCVVVVKGFQPDKYLA